MRLAINLYRKGYLVVLNNESALLEGGDVAAASILVRYPEAAILSGECPLGISILGVEGICALRNLDVFYIGRYRAIGVDTVVGSVR